jgi:hypothetical protein
MVSRFRATSDRVEANLTRLDAERELASRDGAPRGSRLDALLPPVAFLVAALFCFAWQRFDGVVLLLGLPPFAAVGLTPSPGETRSARWIFRDIGASRWRSLALGVFVIGVAAAAFVRVVDLTNGGSLPRAATDLERWGDLLLTLPIAGAYAVDGLTRRSPCRLVVGILGLALAFVASWLGLAWKDALAVTFAGLALLTAIAGAVFPET